MAPSGLGSRPHPYFPEEPPGCGTNCSGPVGHGVVDTLHAAGCCKLQAIKTFRGCKLEALNDLDSSMACRAVPSRELLRRECVDPCQPAPAPLFHHCPASSPSPCCILARHSFSPRPHFSFHFDKDANPFPGHQGRARRRVGYLVICNAYTNNLKIA